MNSKVEIKESQSLLISGIPQSILDAIDTSLKVNELDITSKLIRFWGDNFAKAIANINSYVIDQWKFFPFHAYHKLTRIGSSSNNLIHLLTSYQKDISIYFKSAINGKELDEDQHRILPSYFESTLFLFRELLTSEDDEIFKIAFNDFNQISDGITTWDTNTRITLLDMDLYEDINERLQLRATHFSKNEFRISHRRASLILLSWTIFLYEMDKINKDKVIRALDNIKIKYQFFEDLLEDVIAIRETAHLQYLTIQNWDYENRLSGNFFQPPYMPHWILYGCLILLIKNENIHFKMEAIVYNKDYAFLAEPVNDILTDMVKNSQKWDSILCLSNRIEDINISQFLQNRSDQIRNYFQQIIRYHSEIEAKKIAISPLNIKLISAFKEENALIIDNENRILKLFDFYQKIDRLSDKRGINSIDYTIEISGGKRMFLDSNTQLGLPNYGGKFISFIENVFLKVVASTINTEPTAIDIDQAIESSIGKIISKGKLKPNVLMIPSNLITRRNFYADLKREIDDELKVIFTGIYKSLYVFELNNFEEIIVCDFEEAFQLQLFESDALLKNRYDISINPLTQEEIIREYSRSPHKYKYGPNGHEESDELAMLRMADNIIIKFSTFCQFRIKNPDAVVRFYIGRY